MIGRQLACDKSKDGFHLGDESITSGIDVGNQELLRIGWKVFFLGDR